MPAPDNLPLISTPLQTTGIIRVTGDDAASFLHGQLSKSIHSINETHAPLAAWHTPAGRVRAIFRILRMNDSWLLATDASLIETLLTELRRFILRDNVVLEDAGTTVQGAAFLGNVDDWLLGQGLSLGSSHGDRLSNDGIEWLRLGPRFIQAWSSVDRLAPFTGKLPQTDEQTIEFAEIALGIPRLTPETRDRFIPQMLNLDLLGAIDHDKGCFPGQELIARTKNLGTVKRRQLRFSAEAIAAPHIGSNIIDATGAPQGEVLRSAGHANGVEFLAVTNIEHAQEVLFSEIAPAIPLRRERLPWENAAISPA